MSKGIGSEVVFVYLSREILEMSINKFYFRMEREIIMMMKLYGKVKF